MTIVSNQQKKVYPIIFPSQYSGMGSINCYIFQNGEDFTLIDAGIDTPDFQQFFLSKLKQYNVHPNQINRIVLTHFHADHTGMVNALTANHPIPVYASTLAIPRLKFEESYLQQKISFYDESYEQFGVLQFANERMEKLRKTLKNRKKLRIHTEIFPLKEEIAGLQILKTPGHSPDSISLYDHETGWLFAGDFIIETGMTSALLEHDEEGEMVLSLQQYEQSFEQLEHLPVSNVFAGHKNVFQNLDEVIQNSKSKINYKLAKVMKKIEEGHTTAISLGQALYGPRFETHFTFTISEVIGYTELARKRGFIERVWKEKQWHFIQK